jgi:hypothetical protein
MTYQFTLSFPWSDKAAGLANRAPGGRSRAARGMAQTFWPFIREGLIGEAEVRAALADASQRNGLVKTNGAYSGSFKYVRADGGEVHLVPKRINYIAPFTWKSRSSPLPKGAGPCLLGDYWVRFAWFEKPLKSLI